jgi:RNA polymerase sigma-70 factor (ECF subfamily)
MSEDKLLVSRLKRGDGDAMCRVYQKYKDYLLTLARALLGQQAEAQDVVHDVFVSFARTVRQVRFMKNLKGYLAACVANRARDKIRARARQAAANPHLARQGVIEGNNPEQCAIEQEELVRLRRAMTRVSYEQREVVILRIKAQMKFREIAKLQGVSTSTTCARYRYGLDRLRSMLNSEVQ